MRIVARVLMIIGRLVPLWLPRGSAIGNRILKPIYKFLYPKNQRVKVNIWGNITMNVDPTECIGGNLFFSPHLYDTLERDWISSCLPANGVFVDVGANIGAYTLWASKYLGNDGSIIAIEADPDTYNELVGNISIDSHMCRIKHINVGVSDKSESLKFYRNTKGNRGGNSFRPRKIAKFYKELETVPLYDVIVSNDIECIDFLKIDIEGYELKVLSKFFSDCINLNRLLLPSYILIEIDEGPRRDDEEYKRSLLNLFDSYGYEIIHKDKNYLYSLSSK